MKKLLIFSLIGLTALSCKEKNNDPAPDTCKLSTSPSVKKLTYNNGRVSTLTTEGYDGNTTVIVLSTFTYDATGKLTKTVYTVNGNPNSEETYTYTDGRITRVNFSGPNSPMGLNNLSYDAAGRLARYTVEVGGKLQYAQTYTYNANGVLTEQAVVDGQGSAFFKTVIKPIGNVKSPEQLLINQGIPYLIPTGDPLVAAEGNIGTVKDYFSVDDTGKLVPVGSEKTTALKTNAKGYLTELTTADPDGKNPSTVNYTLADCD
jgi:YD repeat-containing protein